MNESAVPRASLLPSGHIRCSMTSCWLTKTWAFYYKRRVAVVCCFCLECSAFVHLRKFFHQAKSIVGAPSCSHEKMLPLVLCLPRPFKILISANLLFTGRSMRANIGVYTLHSGYDGHSWNCFGYRTCVGKPWSNWRAHAWVRQIIAVRPAPVTPFRCSDHDSSTHGKCSALLMLHETFFDSLQ